MPFLGSFGGEENGIDHFCQSGILFKHVGGDGGSSGFNGGMEWGGVCGKGMRDPRQELDAFTVAVSGRAQKGVRLVGFRVRAGKQKHAAFDMAIVGRRLESLGAVGIRIKKGDEKANAFDIPSHGGHGESWGAVGSWTVGKNEGADAFGASGCRGPLKRNGGWAASCGK